MARMSKLEQVLYLLDNGETEKAEELIHEYIVEKGRMIYEEIVNTEDDLEDDLEEAIGGEGDELEDFESDIEADSNDIETDELNDGEVDFEDDIESEDEEEELEDKVDDLEAQLDELRAEFDKLISAELEEPEHEDDDLDFVGDSDVEGEEEDEYEFDIGGEEEEEQLEAIEEATKLQDEVSVDMSKEGKLAGTGKNSKTGATNSDAPFTKAPGKSVDGSKPVDFTKGGDEKGGKGESAKNETPSDNIDENPSNISAKEQKAEGDLVGTGKQSKKGKTNTKSPLSSAPKKP